MKRQKKIKIASPARPQINVKFIGGPWDGQEGNILDAVWRVGTSWLTFKDSKGSYTGRYLPHNVDSMIWVYK